MIKTAVTVSTTITHAFASQLESHGYDVYFPLRDTNQRDNIGLRICQDNRKAIKAAHTIYIAWDGKSQGVLFDLGIAFAFNKKIIPITGYFPTLNHEWGKSFTRVVWALNAEQYNF